MPAEQSNQCDDIQPWLAAYALGEAEDEDAPRAHLLACPQCRRALHEYRRVAGMLPYGAPDVLPRAELREQIIAAIKRQAADSEPAGAAPARSPKPIMSRRRPRSFWAAFAFATLAVALLAWNLLLQRDLQRQQAQVALSRQSWQTMIALLNDTSLSSYAVVGEVAHGHFWTTPKSQAGCLVAQGLPELREGQVYQVWLVRDAKLSSGGTFQARNGNGWIVVRASEPLAAYTSVLVTVEPEGGSAAPGGAQVMSGTLLIAMPPGSANRHELLSLLSRLGPRRD